MSHHKARRRGIIIATVAALIFVAVFVMVGRPQRNVPERSLGDGTKVALEAVTFGREHRFGPPDFPFRFMRQVLKLPIRPTIRHYADQNNLVLWLSNLDKEGDSLPFDSLGWIQIRDSEGNALLPDDIRLSADYWSMGWHGRSRGVPPPNAKSMILQAAFNNFPRRESVFTVELYNLKREKMAAFEVQNPAAQRDYPEWSAPSLPATNSWGDWRFVLREIKGFRAVNDHFGFQFDTAHYAPQFDVFHTGELVTSWRAERVEFTDATGNKLRPDDGPLAWAESAIKVSAVFVRTATGEFDAGEVWDLGVLEIPAPGETREMERTRRLGKVDLTLTGVAGAGAVDYVDGKPVSSSPIEDGWNGQSMSSSSSFVGGVRTSKYSIKSAKPSLVITHSELPDGVRLSLLGQNEQGEWHLHNTSYQNDGKGLFLLNRQDNPNNVPLKVLVHRTHPESFLAPVPEVPEWSVALDQIAEYRRSVPARPSGLSSRQVDLTSLYTIGPRYGGKSEHIHAGGMIPNGSASRSVTYDWLPRGTNSIGGLLFDTRAVCQLTGLALVRWIQSEMRFPFSIGPIPIESTVSQLHFLHGAVWHSEQGTLVGRYEVEFDDGETIEIPIIYGVNVGESVSLDHGINRATRAELHSFADPKSSGRGNLYLFTWDNPRPQVRVKSIRMTSAMTSTAPFLAALNIEPVPVDQ